MCYIVFGGGYMSDQEPKRLQITLSPDVLEQLDSIAKDMGLKRSALVSFLVKKFWKEEYTGREK